MKSEIIVAIIGAVFGSLCTWLVTVLTDHRREKREERLEEKKLQHRAFLKYPEMEIADYRDYISRTGYGVKQKCDIELFVAHIEKVTIED